MHKFSFIQAVTMFHQKGAHLSWHLLIKAQVERRNERPMYSPMRVLSLKICSDLLRCFVAGYLKSIERNNKKE